jgi:hypothetical protein
MVMVSVVEVKAMVVAVFLRRGRIDRTAADHISGVPGGFWIGVVGNGIGSHPQPADVMVLEPGVALPFAAWAVDGAVTIGTPPHRLIRDSLLESGFPWRCGFASLPGAQVDLPLCSFPAGGGRRKASALGRLLTTIGQTP